MVVLFGVFLLTLLVITAIAIVRTRNLFVAVMLTGIFSLLMAANFFILDAADVALTEAAVGAGISTVLFLSALALTAERERSVSTTRWLSIPVVVATTLIVIYATFDKPRLGDPDAPVHQHVAPWYLDQTPELIDIPNVDTAVLGSFRGYDTLGEVFVDRGYDVVSGGTDNHLLLISLVQRGVTGKAADEALGRAHITVNKNLIPFDPEPAEIASARLVSSL